ncbi:MAG TPA: Asp23/Gls24 family envelope stress response protein [Candidatus Dorea intestinavium]|nr:Asp23/Gls24 family envelope stress response protein [Candidatus Dorea intestinavium]
MEKEVKDNYTVTAENSVGEVQIADEVVAIIAGIAATEVEGVASMAGNATKDLIQKLGRKSISKGIKVEILESVVTVFVSINIKYGYNIIEITRKVQEKVKNAIESMTGLTVSDVNVRVVGVDVSEEA